LLEIYPCFRPQNYNKILTYANLIAKFIYKMDNLAESGQFGTKVGQIGSDAALAQFLP